MMMNVAAYKSAVVHQRAESYIRIYSVTLSDAR